MVVGVYQTIATWDESVCNSRLPIRANAITKLEASVLLLGIVHIVRQVLAVDHEAGVGLYTRIGLASIGLLGVRMVLVLGIATVSVFRLGLDNRVDLLLNLR